MKNALLTFALILALASCKKEEKEVTIEGGADTTVVVNQTVPAPETVTDTVIVEDKDGTSVNISSDGVNVDSKDGTNKTSVNVTKDGAGVEIKK